MAYIYDYPCEVSLQYLKTLEKTMPEHDKAVNYSSE